SLLLLFFLRGFDSLGQETSKLRLAVAGLNHGHVGWVLSSMNRGDYEIVGISESNRELAEKYSKQYGFSMSLVYDDLNEMLEKSHPEAVAAFGETFSHLA
ncbi:MAG TPA: oxidoreductase, partial [Algoriphagus sp.]|nr:oxidoreductase [Algoriphagus sp.]